MDISLETVRMKVEEIIGQGQATPGGHIPFTPRAKKVLELALREALQLGHTYIGTEHILLGLVREGEGVAAEVLVSLGANLDRVRQAVIGLLEGYGAIAEPGGEMPARETAYRPLEPPSDSESKPSAAPTCANCFAPLSDTLAIKRIAVTLDDEPAEVRIAYCSRCGVALGTVS